MEQGSHTFQMMTFKGISSVIKGSTAHFQGYFGKLYNVILLYINKISSNFSQFYHIVHVFMLKCYALSHGIIRFRVCLDGKT